MEVGDPDSGILVNWGSFLKKQLTFIVMNNTNIKRLSVKDVLSQSLLLIKQNLNLVFMVSLIWYIALLVVFQIIQKMGISPEELLGVMSTSADYTSSLTFQTILFILSAGLFLIGAYLGTCKFVLNIFPQNQNY